MDWISSIRRDSSVISRSLPTTRKLQVTIPIVAVAIGIASAGHANQVLPRANPLRVVGSDPTPSPSGIPVPRARPSMRGTPVASNPPTTSSPPQEKVVQPQSRDKSVKVSPKLKAALDALSADQFTKALLIRAATTNALDRKIIDWLMARSGNKAISERFIRRFAGSAGNWPDKRLLAIRSEVAFGRKAPKNEDVLRRFSKTQPLSTTGKIMLARAYLATGRKAEASKLIRPLWRKSTLSAGLEKRILKDAGSVLSHADHKARSDWMLYRDRTRDALRLKRFLSEAERQLMDARIALIRRKRAGKALAAVPNSMKSDPLYLFTRIQYLRRARKTKDAMRLLQRATRDPKKLIHPDEWWVERRLVSRKLLNTGNYKAAYRLAAEHSAQKKTLVVEAEFHAGWYALRFLKDPAKARKHFEKIKSASKGPLSQARASYWLGRTAEATGIQQQAALHYKIAGRYPATYYGQLARAKLGHKSVGLGARPRPDAAEKTTFKADPRVIAIKRLAAAGHGRRTLPLFMHMARQFTSKGQAALLVGLAESLGQHRFALISGKIISRRLPGTERLAFPTSAIPKATKIVPPTERALVYAIARQESAFHPGAISHAGARGLLQLMPGTARKTARNIGKAYSKRRLTTDPAYNATLGSAHLGELLQKFNGSYVLTFVAYNAGSRRVDQWIARYGDPRSRKVDAIDWVERIPFTETRNYVQRIMENLQVYRARFQGGKLTIASDLRRGG